MLITAGIAEGLACFIISVSCGGICYHMSRLDGNGERGNAPRTEDQRVDSAGRVYPFSPYMYMLPYTRSYADRH